MRWAYAVLGILCVGLGGLGVVVPGLPTTIFLILATYFFARSCPWLETRLVRNRFFGPYLRYIDGDAVMPRKAKITAIAMMWSMIALSSVVLVAKNLPWPVVVGVVVLGVVGTIVIWRYRGIRRVVGAPAPVNVAA